MFANVVGPALLEIGTIQGLTARHIQQPQEASVNISSVSNVGQVDYSAARQKMLDRMTKAMDQDGDGSISKAEFTKSAEAMRSRMPAITGSSNVPSVESAFTAVDTSGDDAISKDELSSMLDHMAPMGGRPGTSGGPQGPGGGPQGPGGPPASSSDEVGTLAGAKKASTDPADTNGDGKVSTKEEQSYLVKQALAAYRASASAASKTTESKEPAAA